MKLRLLPKPVIYLSPTTKQCHSIEKTRVLPKHKALPYLILKCIGCKGVCTVIETA